MGYLCSLQGLWQVFKKQTPNPYYTQSIDAPAPALAPALPEDLCREFSLAEIKAATNNFHPDSMIEEGDFGHLYRGIIDHGHGTKVVAIKRRSSEPFQGKREIQNEVVLLCQLRHPHLVSLIGICLDQNQVFLVYEYMSRWSLRHHLHFKDNPPLVWEQRLKICIGAARGLHYLHTGAKYVVIHRHITSSNILLDDEWGCKLGDFGLSIRGPLSTSKAVIRKMETVLGTYGYADPAYVATGEVTEKCDVYSFGVVLFEVLCGRRVINLELPPNQQNLLTWALKLGRGGSIYDAIDPYLRGRIAPQCLDKYLEIACSCIHYDANERPAMGEVEVTLELALELQKKADSEILEATKPYGDQWMYEDARIPSSVFNFDCGW